MAHKLVEFKDLLRINVEVPGAGGKLWEAERLRKEDHRQEGRRG